MIAGGAASVTFQPKSLDMVHRRTGGIPRLVNLVCDRSLLAAYSARTNRVSPDMVDQAADNLELVGDRPSRFGWLSRRASVVAAAAGATVSLAVAGSLVVPALRASATAETAAAAPQASQVEAPAPVTEPVQASASPTTEPLMLELEQTAERYSVLVASFPIAELSKASTEATARFDAVVRQLQSQGYDVRLMEVDLPARGEWRRVLVGEFGTLAQAKAEAGRLHQMPGFSDAQVIKY